MAAVDPRQLALTLAAAIAATNCSPFIGQEIELVSAPTKAGRRAAWLASHRGSPVVRRNLKMMTTKRSSRRKRVPVNSATRAGHESVPLLGEAQSVRSDWLLGLRELVVGEFENESRCNWHGFGRGPGRVAKQKTWDQTSCAQQVRLIAPHELPFTSECRQILVNRYT